MDITKAPMIAMKNREVVARATTCGCFNCLKIYPPSDIVTWTDFGETAICPHCDRDMVLPEVDETTLAKVHAHWIPEGKNDD